MSQPTVSILVPVYNVERYLAQCLDSLCAQTLHDIEIICIDDGSTDSSPSIMADYAVRDGRIRVITKSNTGYGDSMNRGLAEADGAWVGICEPDDFCDKRMYATLVSAGERHGCDMVKSNYREHSNDSRRDPTHEVLAGFPYNRAFSPRERIEALYIDPTIWTGLYRSNMLAENGVAFTPSPGASYQDASFAHQCWMSAQRVVFLKQGFYHYRIDNAASSSKSGDKVFAVCEEYDRSITFARRRGAEDFALFGPRLTVLRFGVYVWNYNRISVDHHIEFAERWIADVVRASEEGVLDLQLLTPEYRALISELLDGAESFCRRYPDTIPILPLA